MSCSRWACRSSARAPQFDFHSVNGQLLMKSKPPETASGRLLRAWTSERAPMPLLRQLEFAFQTVGWEALRPPNPQTPTKALALKFRQRDVNLETKACALLCSLGAARGARDLRVEWNSRLRTAAGRADYRQKLISLNPRLFEHPAEIDQTLRHELAHILAQFRAGRRRVLPHGIEWRQARRDLYRCPNCQRNFPRVRRIKRAVACLACCRAHNRGKFDAHFRLVLVDRDLRARC